MKFGFNQLRALMGGITLVFALGGCNSGSSTSSSSLSGTAMAGPFLSGTVCAYQVKDGAKGDLLGVCSSIVSATSSFSVDVGAYTGDVLVEISNASYDDEANPDDNVTGTPLNGVMRNLIHIATAGGTVELAVTPLTEAALQLAGATLNNDTVQAAINQLAGLLPAVAGLDLRATLPVLTTAQGLAYREALRALSQLQWASGVGEGGFRGNLNGFLGNLVSRIGANGNTVATDILGQINSGLNGSCAVVNNALTCTIAAAGGNGGTGNVCVASVSLAGANLGDICYTNLPAGFNCGALGVGDTLSGYAGATVTFSTPAACPAHPVLTFDAGALGGSGNAGGNAGEVTCNTTHYQAGAVHAPTANELASYAKTYNGNTGSFDMSGFTSSGAATLVFSNVGGLTYNGTAQTVNSVCADNTHAMLYVEFGGAGAVDLFADNGGGFSGNLPNMTGICGNAPGCAGGNGGGNAGGNSGGNANPTAGTAANGSPALDMTKCANTIAAGSAGVGLSMNMHLGCGAASIADFANLTVVDQWNASHATCTASYSNGVLTVSNGTLTASAAMNGDANDSITTWVSGATEMAMILAPVAVNGVNAEVAKIRWKADGTPDFIQGGAVAVGGVYQLFTCTLLP